MRHNFLEKRGLEGSVRSFHDPVEGELYATANLQLIENVAHVSLDGVFMRYSLWNGTPDGVGWTPPEKGGYLTVTLALLVLPTRVG